MTAAMVFHHLVLAGTCFPNCHAVTNANSATGQAYGGNAALGIAFLLVILRIFVGRKGSKGSGK